MIWSYVIFRYQPDLRVDDWVPLGVVVERSFDNGTAGIGVMCLSEIEISGSSDFAAAMLKDVLSILTSEVDRTRARLRPEEDFLEVLRAQSPCNFHFTQVETCNLETEDIREAVMKLFYRDVLQRDTQQPTIAIKPRRMDAFEVAI